MIESSQKLRTALIGLGRIGWQFHLPEIMRNDKFELAAVVDTLDERLQDAVKQYQVPCYLDYWKMLKDQKPDLVVVASPTPFHKEQTMAAFDAGCDVFCEKPVTMNLQELRDILNAAKSCGRKFMTYQPYRAFSETIALKDILSRNLIGQVYMIRRNWFEYTRRNDWQSLKKFGGGMLNNYGAHFVDQLLYLSDYSADKISCVTRNLISPGDAEDFVKILIETGEKTLLDIEINLACPQPLPIWQILGQYGSIIMNEADKCWEVKYCKPQELSRIEVQSDLAAAGRAYRKDADIKWHTECVSLADYKPINYYDKCYEFFALDMKPFVPVEQTFELMRTLERCGEIGRSGDDISKNGNPPFGYSEVSKIRNVELKVLSH